ncbi:MAG TPA: aspartate carbamoyltransferase catalytic subunit [Dehalococcoidia bacterium]|nr:aspartate carbamoyltransferase catalytic subunit [Dehalococcoidia bacterium]
MVRQGAGPEVTNSHSPILREVPPAAPDWKRRHVLDLDDFSRDEIEMVLDTAEAMREILGREIRRVPSLRGVTVVTLFYEASTRTRASFELAGKILGADVINLSAGGSSVEKGETLVDTVRTLQAIGADVVVMRHSSSGAPYLAARDLDAAIVNAGDGLHAHPTQALLDIFTLRSHLGDLRGKRIAIVGDVLHSRVARSDLWGLAAVGADVVLCGPPTLLPAVYLRPEGDRDRAKLPPARVELDLNRALQGADVVMTLRLQAERQRGGLLPSLREYSRLYEITEARLTRAAPNALVMHPGPMNEGVEIAPAVAHGSQSLVEEQVKNGVAIRMALLYLLSSRRPPAPAPKVKAAMLADR